MARPIEYDLEHVLDRSLNAFWNLGYAACSFQELTVETGLSRQSIYNAFGDKDGLFQAAVSHYKDKVAQQLQPLSEPTADIEDIRMFMKNSLEAQGKIGPGACFLVITAFGPKANEPKIQAAIEEGAALVRTAFENVLRHKASSSLRSGDHPPEDTAAYLYCVMNGLSALRQTGGQTEQVDTTLDHVFHSIRLQ